MPQPDDLAHISAILEPEPDTSTKEGKLRKASSIVLWIALAVVALTTTAAAEPHYATGVVFHDTNHNGTFDPGEKGLPDVRVSNSRDVVVTDATGHYRLPITDDTMLFVVKPRDWATTVDGNSIPRYYYIHKPNGSPELRYKGVDPTGPLPESVDFPLYPHKEPDRFTALFFGDTQPYERKDVFYLQHDIIEELIGTDAAFGVTLGDVVGNQLELYDILVPAIARIGVPWYYVKGNHDTNYDGAPNQYLTDETWERVFGPSYYSFDYGPVHFVALNNPYWVRTSGYSAQLDLRQMTFLRNDIALVPSDRLIVLMMHIPITQMSDRDEVYRILSTHPYTFSISGHTHTQDNRFVTRDDGWPGEQPHHHLVNGTACGSWWGGMPDDQTIPISTMSDGTPNGYSIITFDGSSYLVRYKVARRPDDYQMNIYLLDEVPAADAAKTEVFANVFAGSERSSVEMKLDDGPWTAMEKTRKTQDPLYQDLKELEKSWKPAPGYSNLPGSDNCTHLWKLNLPNTVAPGTHVITVRTTDMYGQTYTGRRVFVVL